MSATGGPEANAANIGEAWTFTAVDIPRLVLPYRDGVVVYRPAEWPRSGGPAPTEAASGAAASAAGPAATAPTGPVPIQLPDPHRGRPAGQRSVHLIPVDGNEAARVAVGLALRHDAGSVVVHPRYCPASRTAHAIAFAMHLARARFADGLASNVVTTASAPDLGQLPGHIRVPHLLTVRAAPEATSERTVWEILSLKDYHAWLGGTAPDGHDIVEAHLPGLLALRRLLRRPGSFDRLPGGQRMREALSDAGGSLTIRRVYRDPDVFLPAAHAVAGILG